MCRFGDVLFLCCLVLFLSRRDEPIVSPATPRAPDPLPQGKGESLAQPNSSRPWVQNLETRVSFAVMNSSSAGLPALVCSMPRWIAALIWSGSVTRSP